MVVDLAERQCWELGCRAGMGVELGQIPAHFQLDWGRFFCRQGASLPCLFSA